MRFNLIKFKNWHLAVRNSTAMDKKNFNNVLIEKSFYHLE